MKNPGHTNTTSSSSYYLMRGSSVRHPSSIQDSSMCCSLGVAGKECNTHSPQRSALGLLCFLQIMLARREICVNFCLQYLPPELESDFRFLISLHVSKTETRMKKYQRWWGIFSRASILDLLKRGMGEALKGFEPIYGTIQGQIEGATFQEQYPFLFCLRAKDDSHLQFFTTDFHSNTWLVEKSIGELEELVKIFVIFSQIWRGQLTSPLLPCFLRPLVAQLSSMLSLWIRVKLLSLAQILFALTRHPRNSWSFEIIDFKNST